MTNENIISGQNKTFPEDTHDWKVLIVDDQKDNLSVAELTLKFYGVEVKLAHHGKEGLEILQTFPANLILLDLSMPEMDGWEMFKLLRADSNLEKIPVIALTAHVMSGDKEKVMEAGFDGYIPKPFNVTSLVDEIKAILHK